MSLYAVSYIDCMSQISNLYEVNGNSHVYIFEHEYCAKYRYINNIP